MQALSTTPSDFVKVVRAIDPDAYEAAANANGTDMDCLGFRWLLSIFALGDAGDTDGVVTFNIQEADDDGAGAADTYADVDSTLQPAAITATAANQNVVKPAEHDLYLRKRWLRWQYDVDTQAWDLGAVCVLMGPKDSTFLSAKATTFLVRIVAGAYA